MHYAAVLSLLALASRTVVARDRCGPKTPGERLIEAHRAHDAELRAPNAAKIPSTAAYATIDPNQPINVATYVHVVTTSAEASNFNQQMVDDQVSSSTDSEIPALLTDFLADQRDERCIRS